MSSCSAQKTLNSTGNSTLTKKGKNPPDVCLEYIVEDLLSYYSGFRYFRSIKKEIEKKYSIKTEQGNCWSADDIKRAWGKTQRMDKHSNERKCWALAITLQLLKREMRNEDLTGSGNVVQKCAELSLLDTSIQLKAERENGREDDCLHSVDDIKQLGASGSAVQCAGTTHTQYCSIPLQLLKREMRYKKLMESGNVDQKCAEEILHETSDQTTADRENGREDDCLHSVDMKLQGASGSAVQCAGSTPPQSSNSMQTHSVSQGSAWTQYGVWQTWNNCNAPYGQSRYDRNTALQSQAAVNLRRLYETYYIQIPVTQMHCKEASSVVSERSAPSYYKLTNGLPFILDNNIPYYNAEIRRSKSYITSFDHSTNNAKWVYEMLNQQTLANNYLQQKSFGNVYDRGHLAAAANHRWCREAYENTFLNSNIIPQHCKLNRGLWKTLERYCRESTCLRHVQNVHVYTGPIYRDKMNAAKLEGKMVPSDFFKVVIVENTDGTVYDPECFLMPNKRPESSDLKKYKSNFNEIQRLTGLHFIVNNQITLPEVIMTLKSRGTDIYEVQQDVEIAVRISYKEIN